MPDYKFAMGAEVRCDSLAAIQNIVPARVIRRKFTSEGREVYGLEIYSRVRNAFEDTGHWYDVRLIRSAK